mmetsp:Transcript_39509/g.86294  ORF Transcript_39509/g.86294 Transcript_39509/m.86294 type:complete len:279 (-) Transcript_39509:3657-4493(-)
MPRSFTIPTVHSPVKAPSPVLLKFWTPTARHLEPSEAFNAVAMWIVVGKRTVSTFGSKALNAPRRSSTSFCLSVDLKFPDTTGLRSMPFGGQPTVRKFSPAYVHFEPSSSSMRKSWLYLARRSDLHGAPVLICPARRPTARSAMNVSSVSPDLWETMTPQPAFVASRAASMASDTEPIWFTLRSRALQREPSWAKVTRLGLVTSRSSPTICVSVPTALVKLAYASKSSWSNGSSMEMRGYALSHSLYSSPSSAADFFMLASPPAGFLKSRSYFFVALS